jgi:hypothetical protein
MKSWTCPHLGLAEQHGFFVDPLLYIDNPVETLIRNESNPSKFGQHPTQQNKTQENCWGESGMWNTSGNTLRKKGECRCVKGHSEVGEASRTPVTLDVGYSRREGPSLAAREEIRTS